MYGIGITDSYLYLNPDDLIIYVNDTPINFKDNCMIPEDVYMNPENSKEDRIYIGHEIFQNKKRAIFDFNNMFFSVE